MDVFMMDPTRSPGSGAIIRCRGRVPEELPGPKCYCGKRGCLETWISGMGVARDYKETTGREQTMREIMAEYERGDPDAVTTVERFEDRLARGLAHVINMLDPDVVIFGGGLSKIKALYQDVPARLPQYVFGGEAATPILPAMYGDSSGVRGAAWLWPKRIEQGDSSREEGSECSRIEDEKFAQRNASIGTDRMS